MMVNSTTDKSLVKSKSSILENLYEIKNSNNNEDYGLLIDEYIDKVISNIIPLSDAEEFIESIKSSNDQDSDTINSSTDSNKYDIKTFFSGLEEKVLYKTIGLYLNNNLSPIKIWKLISSLVTQIIIHIEKYDNFDISESHYYELCDMLTNFDIDKVSELYSRLEKILLDLGYNK